MIGDGEAADEMTRQFNEYWEENAALCNSCLVYNTGRSLGQFVSLLEKEKKGAVLPVPDVLITAVGTKVKVCRHVLLGWPILICTCCAT